MEQKNLAENLWRVWVDTRRRIVSFHEEEGCQLLEFRNRELFLSCVDQYTGMQYRYQYSLRPALRGRPDFFPGKGPVPG